jgi:endoglucanase
VADDLVDLLRRLVAEPGPSSYEERPAAVWREAAASFAAVRGDALGSSFATVNEGGSPRIALIGHIDEIGFVVTNIDAATGALWFGPVGHWDPMVVVGQRVTIATRDGDVPGVIGRKAWHLLTPDQQREAPALGALWIDIGAADGADAGRLVRVGDPVVLTGPPVDLQHGRLASRAIDNRVGALVVLEAARRAAAEPGLQAEVVAVAAAQEETSYGGAAAAAYALEPDLAIVVDVTHAGDYPDPDGDVARRTGRRALGSGPVVTRGASASPVVAEALLELAAEAGIPHTIEAEGIETLTDADAAQLARAGTPCGVVGIPLRYMHSPSETVQLSDIEHTAELVARFCRSLRPERKWTR